MAAPGRVTVTGATELRTAFRRLDDRVTDLDQTASDSADMVEASALSRVPVVSGTLRNTIRTERTPLGVSVLAGGSIPYAEVIHFGWRRRNIEPSLFLWDALDERRDAVIAKYEGKVDKDIRRFDREAPK